MKDFLLTLLSGFLFILGVLVFVMVIMGVLLLVTAIVPKTILYVVGTMFVVWFVGAVIR